MSCPFQNLILVHAHLEDFTSALCQIFLASGFVFHVAHIGVPNICFVACKKTAGCSVLLSVIHVKQW